MSDNYFDEKRVEHLTYWVTGQMLKGAGIAAGCLLAIGVVLWAIYGLGLLLPAESRATPDPMAALQFLRELTTALV
ncbi:MAG: RC-LH1 core complex protein PufX [Pseudomonadota bacterium]